MRTTALAIAIMALLALRVASWELPPDNGTLGKNAIQEILTGNDYPETSTYRQTVEFIDFTAHGQNFTQVVVTLTPDTPRLRNGRKLVVVGAEPGSEYAMDFVSTVEKLEGPAVWLARRGVTFVALTRVGRWNFLAPTKDVVGDGADRRADADLQPRAEGALVFERVRGAAFSTERAGGAPYLRWLATLAMPAFAHASSRT